MILVKIKRVAFILVFLAVIITYQIGIANADIQINSVALTKEGHFPSNVTVHYIVTSPQGYRLGYDTLTRKYYNEFPDEKGSYGDSGIDDIASIEAHLMEPADGNYTIEIVGSKQPVAFSLDVGILRNIKGESFTNFVFEGVIDKGLTSKFQLIYTSDPSKPAGTLTRVATPSSLKQDITLSRKIGWIDNDGIMNSLLKKVEAIEASIAKGNKTSAKNQLNAFINEVNAQKGKHISDKAIKILLEDAQCILTNL